MGGFVDTITGASAKRQASMVEAAQARTASLQEDERQRLARVEAGQKQNAKRGAGGLLSWVSDTADAALKGTLG